MKTKRVFRYYCDFCKKSGGSKWHMEKHEKHCTMNPDRKCRMCGLIECEQHNIPELIETIKPYLVPWKIQVYLKNPYQISQEGFLTLRYKADNCPNCIFATLRQARISIDATMFDYQKECRDFWVEYNKS